MININKDINTGDTNSIKDASSIDGANTNTNHEDLYAKVGFNIYNIPNKNANINMQV